MQSGKCFQIDSRASVFRQAAMLVFSDRQPGYSFQTDSQAIVLRQAARLVFSDM